MSKPAMIHPDHLLDRARCGALPPDEWRRLGAHLAACSACAWEQSVTADFARESLDSDGDLDPSRLAHLIDGALARGGYDGGLTRDAELRTASRSAPHTPGIAVPSPVQPPVRGRAPRALGRWLAAAAMVAAVAAALALPARSVRDGAGEPPSLASTEASLDAGALGTPSGGDS
jgi:hypothetical protein